LATSQPVQEGSSQSDHLSSEPYSAKRLDALLSEGRPVFAYFTADWCVTCKVNERVAINRTETASFFEAQGIVVLVGDWTRQDPAITEMLEAYGRAGVPMYLYFPPGSAVTGAKILPQILTPAVIQASIVAD
jgi:thiol:disulfide interchange protein